MFTLSRMRGTCEPEPRLGMLNGALIGLALALGAWGLGFFAGGGKLSPLWYSSHLLGMSGVILLAGLAGWLAAVAGRAFVSLTIWTAAALGMTWIIGHQAYEGSTLVAWLLDKRFWGLTVYPYIPAALVRQAMAGFFVVLLFGILGLLQTYRLEGVSNALTATRRLSGYAWFLLLLPLPFVLGAGLIADNLVNQPLRRSITIVDEVFQTGRTYEGDLFQLSLERGVNYNAIAGVRQQLGPDYTLTIGEIDLGAAATVFVVAHFEDGAWINCRVVADQLSFCWDASPPYHRGLPALLSGETVADCPECTIVVDDAAQAALAAVQGQFREPPAVRQLAQQGSYVWMRAESPTGDWAVDCLLRGITPVRLVDCRAVSTTTGSAIDPEKAAAHPERRAASVRGPQSKGAERSVGKAASFDCARRTNAVLRSVFHVGRDATTSENCTPSAIFDGSSRRRAAIFRTGCLLILRTAEGTEARSGRTPGLMALAPPEATPEPPAGMALPEPLGMATPDRMAPPPTVYPPAQADLGAQVYWFKCMVCHGDQGQGLTEEWRAAWEPSHRDCWQSRCHAANHPPEGFQFPYYAPPVMGAGTLTRHVTLADLHDYLAGQMPWQAPGSLPGEEYWQLAAYLARTNGATVSDADLNPDAAAQVVLRADEASASAPANNRPPVDFWPFLAGVTLPLALLALICARRQRR